MHPTAEPPAIESFSEWALGDDVQRAILDMGITTPTPIQRLAIGPVIEGRDVIAKAETGTGKTLAFGAPMMSKIDPQRASVLGLVLTPTRELAEQVASVLKLLGAARGIKVALIVGGEPMEPQIRALKGGAQVVVGTPGRVLDLYKQRFLSFPWTEFAILDEADEMLEIGFIDDVRMILGFTPDERQTLLFSATFPPALLKLAREHTRNPIEVATASGLKTVDSIEQRWMEVSEDDRVLALIRIIEQSEPDDVLLIFCDRRGDVDRLFRRLERLPYSIKALHGGYDQEARFRVMSAFRTGEVKALVATDVASRGLDVLHVSHVINYDAPRDITDYTHRIGRTGRAGRKGKAITLVTPMGARRWKPILKQATWDIPQAELPGPSRDPRRRDRNERSDRDRPPDRPRAPERDRAPERTRVPQRERAPAPEGPPEPAREPERAHEPERERRPERPRAPERQRAPAPERPPERAREPERERGRRPERSPHAAFPENPGRPAPAGNRDLAPRRPTAPRTSERRPAPEAPPARSHTPARPPSRRTERGEPNREPRREPGSDPRAPERRREERR